MVIRECHGLPVSAVVVQGILLSVLTLLAMLFYYEEYHVVTLRINYDF